MSIRKLVERYKGETKGSRFFGVLLEDLSKEELIACLFFLHKEKEKAMEDCKKTRETILGVP